MLPILSAVVLTVRTATAAAKEEKELEERDCVMSWHSTAKSNDDGHANKAIDPTIRTTGRTKEEEDQSV